MQTLFKLIIDLANELNVNPQSLILDVSKSTDRDGDIVYNVSVSYDGEILEEEQYYDEKEMEFEISEVEHNFPEIQTNY